jgi:hypothetical protein
MVGTVAKLGTAALIGSVGAGAAYALSGYLGNPTGYTKAFFSGIGAALDVGLGAAGQVSVKAASYGMAFFSTSTGRYMKATYGYGSYVAQAILGFVYGKATEEK